MPRERNYVARSPLLRKGGVHTESKTGSRVRQRLKVEDAVDEWYENTLIELEDNKEEEGSPKGSPFLWWWFRSDSTVAHTATCTCWSFIF